MNYGKFSKSYLLENRSENGKLSFVDVTNDLIPDLVDHTMVTDALWVDFDKDQFVDLILTNE